MRGCSISSAMRVVPGRLVWFSLIGRAADGAWYGGCRKVVRSPTRLRNARHADLGCLPASAARSKHWQTATPNNSLQLIPLIPFHNRRPGMRIASRSG